MFRGLKSLLPDSLGLRVFVLYALSLMLTLTVGLTAFFRLQLGRHIEETEAAAATLSQVMVQTIADSAVIGDYDTIDKTLRKALSRSPFESAAFIDLKGGRITQKATPAALEHAPPAWLVETVGRQLEPMNTIISAGGRDYGVLRLAFGTERIAAGLWEVMRASILFGLGGLAFGLVVIGMPVYRWMRNLKRIDSFEAEIREGRIDPTRIIDPDAPIEIRRAFEVLTRTAASLQAQRNKADITLHAIADAVLTLDTDGTVVYANPAAAAMLGRTEGALLGASIGSILLGADVRGLSDSAWQQRRFSVPAVAQEGVERMGDSPAARALERILDTSLAPIVAGEGQPAGFVLACHDITETYRLDQRLRKEFASRQQALESLRALLLRLVPASRRPDIEQSGDDITAVSEMLTELVREREASRSMLVRAKLDAEASNRAKSEFLANMSHEIRTPMNAILGLSELILASPLSAQQHEHLSLVKTSADALLGIINDILDFSKIEAGRMELESVAFDLAETLGEIIRPHMPPAVARGLSFTLDMAPDVPRRVVGDPLRLGQVLTNLIGNALKFTEQGFVRVRVGAYPAGAGRVGLRIEVIDSGIGIEPVALQGIFEAFSQADSSITRRYGGTGLGLTISRRLALTMKGDLKVDSTVGKGSTFTLELPMGLAPEARERPTVAPRADDAVATPLNLLLVEDNLINQKLAVTLLGQAGHKVVVAADGQEGVERWREGRFDAILMDVQMPVMDGLEATRRIRQAERGGPAHVHIIAMTANAMAGDRERCLDSGMDDYLAKPFRRADLQAVLAKVPVSAPVGALVEGDALAAGQRDEEPGSLARPTQVPTAAEAGLPLPDSYCSLLEQVDPEIVDIIGSAFARQYPQAIREVEQAATDRDRDSLARSVHSLKGLFRTFNADVPARMAQSIERACMSPQPDWGRMLELSQGLRQEGDAFCDALTVHLTRSPSELAKLPA